MAALKIRRKSDHHHSYDTYIFHVLGGRFFEEKGTTHLAASHVDAATGAPRENNDCQRFKILITRVFTDNEFSIIGKKILSILQFAVIWFFDSVFRPKTYKVDTHLLFTTANALQVC